MERLDQLDAVAVPMPGVNCDTDQIIPAQYLQKPRADDFGRYLFTVSRFAKDGSEVEGFVLNRPPYRSARILVAGRNFGCGSSREHAVWALYDYGIRAVIAPSFGDIFFINSLKNGLLPIRLPADVVACEIARLEAQPGATIAIDVVAQNVRFSDGSMHDFEIDPFAKECLVKGLDELDYTLARSTEIDAFERGYEAEGSQASPISAHTNGEHA